MARLLSFSFAFAGAVGPCAFMAVAVAAAPADEPVDLGVVTRIRDEGMFHSQVMDTMAELTDPIGPRVTGAPGYRKAAEWAVARLKGYGLAAHTEAFGPPWSAFVVKHASLHMAAPVPAILQAVPRAWSGSTGGARRGKLVRLRIEGDDDFGKWKGKLAGAIVLRGTPPEPRNHDKPDVHRDTADDLAQVAQVTPRFRPPRGEGPAGGPSGPGGRGPAAGPAGGAGGNQAGGPGGGPAGGPPAGPGGGRNRGGGARGWEMERKQRRFFTEEKVLAVLDPSPLDYGTIGTGGVADYLVREAAPTLPMLVVASETWGRLARMADRKVEVELEVDVDVEMPPVDPQAVVNVIAELPGTDKKAEVVMLGAHLDSWHGATGATDNGAGVGVMIEAMRILKAIGVKPRRTIRVGLWGAEELGLLGSRAYVAAHLGTRPPPKEPAEGDVPVFMREPGPGLPTLKPEHGKLSVYFNLDNGAGKIRGIFAEENAGTGPIFRAWLAPLADLGATTLTMRSTGSTDHVSFLELGLPAFQFIQDDLDYDTRSHHTTADAYERLVPADLMQAAVVVATFAYHAAMRPELLPRKPLPDGRL